MNQAMPEGERRLLAEVKVEGAECEEGGPAKNGSV